MDKTCLECNEIFKGRADKKFCSDMCRNSYNNRLNSDGNNYVRNLNNILRKNRRVLEEHILKNSTKISKKKLLESGYNFNYHTNLYTTQKGANYVFCYEYGYLPLDNDYYFLVKRKESKENL
jgi:hypothetical protein